MPVDVQKSLKIALETLIISFEVQKSLKIAHEQLIQPICIRLR